MLSVTEELTKAFEGGKEVEDEEELSLEERDGSTHTASFDENEFRRNAEDVIL